MVSYSFTVRTERQPPHAEIPRPLPAPGNHGPGVSGAISGRQLPLVFLSAAAHANSASTLLRGHQLSALVAQAFPERYAVAFTEDAGAVKGAVVLLTKGAMATLKPDEIGRASCRERVFEAV